jgi:glutathione S-transferase
VTDRIKIYGTTTSPFVRRLRVVAAELGVDVERIDTATDAGQAALREVSPIRKVPVAIVDLPSALPFGSAARSGEAGPCERRTLFDSRAIIELLTSKHGWGGLAAPRDRWQELNLVNAIDAALDSVIQLFYLRRDGVVVDGTPYAHRQLDRADAIFGWIGPQLRTDALGLPEISAIAALDWMDFRGSYDTKRAASCDAARAAWREHPSLVATRPHA